MEVAMKKAHPDSNLIVSLLPFPAGPASLEVSSEKVGWNFSPDINKYDLNFQVGPFYDLPHLNQRDKIQGLNDWLVARNNKMGLKFLNLSVISIFWDKSKNSMDMDSNYSPSSDSWCQDD